ncbi:autotransporter domain-containing protein [Alienimonas sp. DA493]|uniref:autotransporter domain-containing protein n=1 Tax=Alienimonas sp. DA493 TaxID=3373605 RepID=UPI0037545A44
MPEPAPPPARPADRRPRRGGGRLALGGLCLLAGLSAATGRAADQTVPAGVHWVVDSAETVDRVTVQAPSGSDEALLTVRGSSGGSPGFLTATYVRNLGEIDIEKGGRFDARLDFENWSVAQIDGRLNVGGDLASLAGGSLHVADTGSVAVDGQLEFGHDSVLETHGDVDAAAGVLVHGGGMAVATAGTVRTAGGVRFESGGAADVDGRLIADVGNVTLAGGRLAVFSNGAVRSVVGDFDLFGGGEFHVGGAATAGGAVRARNAGTQILVSAAGRLAGRRFDLSDGALLTVGGTADADGGVTVAGADTQFTIAAGGAATAGAVSLTDGGTLSVGAFDAPGSGRLTASSVANADGALAVYGTLVTGDLASAGTFDLFDGGWVEADAVTSSGATMLHGGSAAAFERLAVTGSTFTAEGALTVERAATVSDATFTLEPAGRFEAASLSVTDGTANLGGTTLLHGDAAVSGAGAELHVTGGTFHADGLQVRDAAAATIAGAAEVEGAVSAAGPFSSLTVAQDGRLEADELTVSGGALVAVDARTDGAADGALHVRERTVIGADGDEEDSGVRVDGTASLGETLLRARASLGVTGTADTRNALGVLRDLTVHAGGAVDLSGAGQLTVADLVTEGRLDADGATSITADAVTLRGGTAALHGTADFDSFLLEAGDAAFRGTATVEDLTTNGGALALDGAATVDRLAVAAGTVTAADGAELQVNDATRIEGGSVTLSGRAALGATTVSGGALHVEGEAETDSNLLASETPLALTVDGGLVHVRGGGSLTAGALAVERGGTVAVEGQLTVDSTRIGDGTTGGTLTVDSSAQLGAATVLSDGTLAAGGLLQTGVLQNAGTLRIEETGALTAGAVLLQAGDALFHGTASLDALTVAGGTLESRQSLEVAGDATFADGASSWEGTAAFGRLVVSGGSLTGERLAVAGGTTVAGGTLTLNDSAGLSATQVLGGSLIVARGASTRDDYDDSARPLHAFTLGEAGAVTVTEDGSLFASALSTAGAFDLAGELGLSETLVVTGGTLTTASSGWLHGAGPDPVGLTMTGGAATFGGEADFTGAVLFDGAATTATVGDAFEAETFTVTGGAQVTVADGGFLHLFGDETGPEPRGTRLEGGGALTVHGSAGLFETFVGADSTLTVAGLTTTGAAWSALFDSHSRGLTVDGTVAVTAAGRLFADAVHIRQSGALTVGAGVELGTAPPDSVAAATARPAGALFAQSLTVDGAAALGAVTVRDGGTLTVSGEARTATDFAADSPREALSVEQGGAVTVTNTGALAVGDLSIAGELTVLGDATGRGAVAADAVALAAGGALTIDGGLVTADSFDAHENSDLTVVAGGDFRLAGASLFDSHVQLDGALAAPSLVIDENGTLAGAGTLHTTGGDGLTVRGRIAPGNSPGVMTIAGAATFAPTTIFDIELVATPPGAAPVAGVDYDRIAVRGAAVLDGGTLNALPFGPSADFAVGTRYDVLTAGGGLTVRALPTVVEPLPGLRFVPVVTANSLGLAVGRDGALAPLGRTTNQTAVAGALDAASNGGGANVAAIGPLRDALDTLPTDAAVRSALSQLSGELYAAHLTATNRGSLLFLDSVRAPACGLPYLCRRCGERHAAFADHAGLRGWIETLGAGGRIAGDGNAAAVGLSSVGTAVGLTRSFGTTGPRAELGAFYGYESLTTRLEAVRSQASTDAHRVGLSAAASAGRAYVSAAGFVGFTETDARRTVVVENANLPVRDALSADFGGALAAADAEAGWLFDGSIGTGAELAWAPLIGLRFVRSEQDGFAETGGVTALAVEEGALSELRVRIGARGALALPTPVPASLTLDAFLSRDLSAAATADRRAAFVAAPGSAFVVRGTDFGADRLVLGPGLAIGEGPVRFTAAYRAGLTEQSVLHAGDARLEVAF